MTKTHHPTDKQQRKAIEKRKHSFENEKRGLIRAERASKVWHKLSLEEARLRETEDELRAYEGSNPP